MDVNAERAAQQVLRDADVLKVLALVATIIGLVLTGLGLYNQTVIAPLTQRVQATESAVRDDRGVIFEKLGRIGQKVDDIWARDRHR